MCSSFHLSVALICLKKSKQLFHFLHFTFTVSRSSSRRESQRGSTKNRSSVSPFRRRRRSGSTTRSRSPSPSTPKNTSHSSGFLGQFLHLLQSLITEDCRFPISKPRPSFPPNALQAFCLDVAQVLAHQHEHFPAILSQIAFSVLPAFSTFHPNMLPRLVQFFEECLIRGMLSSAGDLQQVRDLTRLMGE
jgi:hypothetical protein